MAPGALTIKTEATDMYTREQANELAYHVASLLSVRVEVTFRQALCRDETFIMLPPGAKKLG